MRHALIGLLGAIALLGFYFGVLSYANSWDHAIAQFQSMAPWVVALSAGFGIQIGLFSMVRERLKDAKANASAAASGGVSGTSMIACCAHHLGDVLPAMGLGAAAVFFNQYQNVFLAMGLFSSAWGVQYMLSIVKQNSGLFSEGWARSIESIPFDQTKNATIALGIVSMAWLAVFFS